MQIIRPIAVTDAMLTSNVTITETAWSAGTYALGDRRYTSNFDLYEVLVASTTDEPSVGAAKDVPTWGKDGKVNRWAMFGGTLWNKTTRTGGITVDIEPSAVVNAIALFGLTGDDVTVTVTDPVDGVIFTETRPIVDVSMVDGWWSYFFAARRQVADMVFLDLPASYSATITVEITAVSGDAVCGEMVLGRLSNIGVELPGGANGSADYGMTIGITDYSRKERDIFGNLVTIERAYAKRATMPVTVRTRGLDTIAEVLAAIRAVPAVYIGDPNRPTTIIFGTYRDWSVTFTGPEVSQLSIELDGVI